MDDLRRSLSSLDSVEVPDLWPEIERRAAAPESATRRGTGRFQSVLSATKLLLAGAIVALFGGFLLSGVMTPQPSADPAQVPGAAASAAATPSTGPTPTSEAASASGLLARLELDGKRLPPGVFRVAGDGERRFPRYTQNSPPGRKRVSDVKVASNGEVWVMMGRSDGLSYPSERVEVVRLGKPGVAFEDDNVSGSYSTGFRNRSDGSIGVEVGGRLRVFDGQDWTEETSAYELCRWGLIEMDPGSGPVEDWGPGDTTPDGTCWLAGFGDLRRVGTDGAVTSVSAPQIGFSSDSFLPRVTVDAAGTVWAAVSGSGCFGSARANCGFEGLASYDGQAWTFVPFEGDSEVTVTDVAVSPTGVVWVTLFDRQARRIFAASWDGESWAAHGPVKWRTIFLPPGTHFLPDGSIWLASGAVFFDGARLREGVSHVEFSSSFEPSSAFGPGGLVWTTSLGDGDGLYVITPEAVAATEE